MGSDFATPEAARRFWQRYPLPVHPEAVACALPPPLHDARAFAVKASMLGGPPTLRPTALDKATWQARAALDMGRMAARLGL